MVDEGHPPEDDAVPGPRPCPFCKAECLADTDPRFVIETWVWRCPTHGIVAYAISLR